MVESVERVTSSMLASKMKSKIEVYQFLTVDCKAYLCAYDNLTIYYLRDLMVARRKCKFSMTSDAFVQLSSAMPSNICSAQTTLV